MAESWQNICFLVVEDDESLREVVCEFLQDQGAKVFSATQGKEAVEIVKTQKIDFVISDIQMPVMDGVLFLKEIRKTNPNAPLVLLVTGQSQYSEDSMSSFGANGVIFKPFSLDIFKEKIKSLISNM